MQRPVDQCHLDAAFHQPGAQQVQVEIAVVPVDPVAQVVVTQALLEQRHHPHLGLLLDLADVGHVPPF